MTRNTTKTKLTRTSALVRLPNGNKRIIVRPSADKIIRRVNERHKYTRFVHLIKGSSQYDAPTPAMTVIYAHTFTYTRARDW